MPRRIPYLNYSLVMINGHEYLRARIWNAQGKRVSIYGKSIEELCQKADALEHPSDVQTTNQNMVLLAKRSSHTYAKVNMLFKSLFNSAEYSNLITYNPTRNLALSGGIPSKELEPLTDAQTELLLATVRDLPPYVFVMIGLYAGLRREEILALK